MTTGCVILAGGRSSRMGTDKALLSIKNKNFIETLCHSFSFFEEQNINKSFKDLEDAQKYYNELADVLFAKHYEMNLLNNYAIGGTTATYTYDITIGKYTFKEFSNSGCI